MEIDRLRARQSEIQLNRAMLDREEAGILLRIGRITLDHELVLEAATDRDLGEWEEHDTPI